MKRKTPQEKKALSYKKDRRNVYGANDKSSRKNIPLRKAKRNRAYRKKANDILKKAGNEFDLKEIDLATNKVESLQEKDWRKCPDARLGEVVKAKLKSRKERFEMGKTALKNIREILNNLKVDIFQEKNLWVAKAKELNGIQGKGKTKEAATKQLEYIANAAIKNSLGFDVGILIDGNYTEPIIKINQEK